MLLLSLLSPASAFVAGPISAPALRRVPVSVPRMLLADPPIELAAPIALAPSLLLAKDGATELLEEIFINFPIIVTGLAFGLFITQYLKLASPWISELGQGDVVGKLSELPFPWEALVIPAFAVAFFALGKAGVLGTVSGLTAKLILDGWNVIANVILKGAILKY